MSEKKEIRFSITTFLLLLIIIAIISALFTAIVMIGFGSGDMLDNKDVAVKNEVKKPVVNKVEKEQILKPEKVENADIYSMDFNFLKLNNNKTNVVYSPLSIRYALKMLEEASAGESKAQISKLLGERELSVYKSNANLSLANGIFVRDTFKDGIKNTYSDLLKTKYDAEVITDSFESPKTINNWVSNKTFNILPEILPDEPIEEDYMLVNAVAIDLEWIDKFVKVDGVECSYSHEKFTWNAGSNVTEFKGFNNSDISYSGLEVLSSINRYDIVEVLGEESITNTVTEAYREWIKDDAGNVDESEVQKFIPEYMDGYIKELDSNFGRVDQTTDIDFYIDENVKVFAKDLVEVEGTNLQYVGIMPINEDLSKYIETIDDKTVNDLISKLKSFDRPEDFEEGYVSYVKGTIPKFDFNYDLKLKEQLETLGVKDVFVKGTADLSNLTDVKDSYISEAIHKAKIEFTQDGIKAAAATVFGGKGAGGDFNYYFDLPIKEYDITFDKPFMYLIRDVKTGEIWFAGSVYEPKKWEDDPEYREGNQAIPNTYFLLVNESFIE